MESLSGDAQLTEKASPHSAKGQSDIVNQLESHLKVLMQITGATSCEDVLNRFQSQKEASTRLNYLRAVTIFFEYIFNYDWTCYFCNKVTESEKRHLEMERDNFTAELESLRFSDTKENEVYVLHIQKQ